jgi:4-hydroxy-3-methylbut-2-enyl diphosphate reductase
VRRLILSEHLGYCFGVKRAVEIAEGCVPGTAMLGELIHNDRVVAALTARGLVAIDDPADAPPAGCLIRSHGAPPAVFAALAARGVPVVDATCPFVKKIHTLVSEHAEQGFYVVIVGQEGHDEVKGICGYAGAQAIVVQNEAEAALLALPRDAKVCVVAQTTCAPPVFGQVTKIISRMNVKTVEIFDTICYTTYKRQSEAVTLAKKCDLILVVGSHTSANTGKLKAICEEYCPTYLIEKAADLNDVPFGNHHTVGMLSGASTPQGLILEVIHHMPQEELKTPLNEVEDSATQEVVTPETEAAPVVAEVTQDEVAPVAVEAAPAAEEAAPVAVEAAHAAEEVASVAAEAASAAEETAPVAVEEDTPAVEQTETTPVAEEVAPKAKPAPAPEKPKSEFEQAIEAEGHVQYRIGKRITATVLSADEKGVVVRIGGKNDGIIHPDDAQLEGAYDPASFEVGSTVEVQINGQKESETGLVPVSKKLMDQLREGDKVVNDIRDGAVFEVTVEKVPEGAKGLTAHLGRYRVFIPQSQVQANFVRDLRIFEGKKLTLTVLQIDDEKKQIVASHRKVVEDARATTESAFFDTTKVGDQVTGKVLRIAPFGAFVDVKGFDCLAHIVDLAWAKVARVEDILKVGDETDFLVLAIDREKKRVSLGYKQLHKKPFEEALPYLVVGATITGTVVRLAPFGAFVEITKGVDGLVHISEASHEYVKNIADVLKVGDAVTAVITKVDPESRKISLSIKEATPAPEGGYQPRESREEGEGGGGDDRPRRNNDRSRFDRKNEGGNDRPRGPRRDAKPDDGLPHDYADTTGANTPMADLLKGLLPEDEGGKE